MSLQTNSLCARLMCVSTQTCSCPLSLFTFHPPHPMHLSLAPPSSGHRPCHQWPSSLTHPADSPAQSVRARPGLNKMCRSHHSWAYRQPKWGRRRSDIKKARGGWGVVTKRPTQMSFDPYFCKTFKVKFKTYILSAQFQQLCNTSTDS